MTAGTCGVVALRWDVVLVQSVRDDGRKECRLRWHASGQQSWLGARMLDARDAVRVEPVVL